MQSLQAHVHAHVAPLLWDLNRASAASIIEKWRTQRRCYTLDQEWRHRIVAATFIPSDSNSTFVRWLDGDRSNPVLTNLVWVELDETLRNIDSWTVDWDTRLSPDEIKLVRVACHEGLRPIASRTRAQGKDDR